MIPARRAKSARQEMSHAIAIIEHMFDSVIRRSASLAAVTGEGTSTGVDPLGHQFNRQKDDRPLHGFMRCEIDLVPYLQTDAVHQLGRNRNLPILVDGLGAIWDHTNITNPCNHETSGPQ